MKIEDNMQLKDTTEVSLRPVETTPVQTYILKIEHSYDTKVHLGSVTIEEIQALMDKYLSIWVSEARSSEIRITIQKEKK